MCGIVGAAAAPGGRVAGREVARQMCRVIIHRGPDDEGIHYENGAFIGMRRLSIIDLATGRQPVYNEERTIALVFNGEIYNYRELREELQKSGHVFRTRGDAEVIVHGYEEFGETWFERLRGMFGIAIWDARTRKLVLARDRIGKKPVYYTTVGKTLVFGSELKSVLCYPGVGRELSPEALYQYMLMGYVPTPLCIFDGISKLPPGHYLTFQGGQTRLHRYWNLEFEPKLNSSESALVEELRHKLSEAVRVRLVSDVPFGAFLSGGLDSSVVVAMMARHLSRPVKTFSIGFRESEFSELDDARRLAQHVGSEHEELIVDPDALSLLDRLAWHFDEPFADSSAIPTFIVSHMAARHVKMVLSGDGGDEAFGGYDRYVKYITVDRLRRYGGRWPARMLEMISFLPGVPARRRLQWLQYRLRQPYPRCYLSGVALMTPEVVSELLKNGDCPTTGYGMMERRYVGRSGYVGDAVIAGDIESYLLDDILVKVDRMTMANSLEARAPLLDHQLLEFAARIPFRWKIGKGQTKRLLRRVAAELLPPELLRKRKQGFAIPLAQWFRGPLRDLAQDLFHSQRFRERGLFSSGAVQTVMADHMSGTKDRSEHLWVLLMFELWARRFLDSKGAVEMANAGVASIARGTDKTSAGGVQS